MEGDQLLRLMAMTLYLLTVFFPILLFIILLFKNKKQLHDKVLLVWLSAGILNSSVEILSLLEVSTTIPFLEDVNIAFLLLSLFFYQAYCQSALQHEFKWSKLSTAALVPFVLWVVLCVSMVLYGFVIRPGFEEYPNVSQEYEILPILFGIVFMIGFLAISVVVILQKNKIATTKGSVLVKQAGNLQKIVVTSTTIYFIYIIWEYVIPETVKTYEFKLYGGTFLLAVLVSLIFVLALFLIMQRKVLKKSWTDTLLNDSLKELAMKIDKLMLEQKSFLDANFSVSKLAILCDTTPQKITQALKVGANKSFFSLVNEYRVEEAKRLLCHPNYEDYDIVSIGLESGFNSKATFNRVFKSVTGITPSLYRKG